MKESKVWKGNIRSDVWRPVIIIIFIAFDKHITHGQTWQKNIQQLLHSLSYQLIFIHVSLLGSEGKIDNS